MNLQQARAAQKKPGATLVLPLWVFADEWDEKPDAPVCVGLRLLAENDKIQARSLAAKTASERHPEHGADWTDCYNDAIQLQLVALGMCDPNDVRKPTELFPYAEDKVPFALTSKGAAFIFQAIQRYEVATCLIGDLATPEDLKRLAAMLGHVDLATIGPAQSRFIPFLIEMLEPLVGELVDASGVDDATDEGAIVVGKQRIVDGAVGTA